MNTLRERSGLVNTTAGDLSKLRADPGVDDDRRLTILRHREAVTQEMIGKIDRKILRLFDAKKIRAKALNLIRVELIRASGAGSAVSDHEHRTK